MVKKDNKLLWNTLALMLVFAISISIGYLMYSCESKDRNNKKNNDLNNKDENNTLNKEKEEIQKKVDEVKSLIINSDKVIKELEKFSDLQMLSNEDNVQGNFTLDLQNNDNHREYSAYFIKNPIDCVEKKISDQAEANEVNAQKSMIDYDNNLKGYIEEINLDLIQFLQKSYKDAHRMNIERQVDLYDIDTLPGKFM